MLSHPHQGPFTHIDLTVPTTKPLYHMHMTLHQSLIPIYVRYISLAQLLIVDPLATYISHNYAARDPFRGSSCTVCRELYGIFPFIGIFILVLASFTLFSCFSLSYSVPLLLFLSFFLSLSALLTVFLPSLPYFTLLPPSFFLSLPLPFFSSVFVSSVFPWVCDCSSQPAGVSAAQQRGPPGTGAAGGA